MFGGDCLLPHAEFMNTFDTYKLNVAVRIVLIGMVTGLVFHVFQGRILDKGYPYNTFLFLPVCRFSDFYDVLCSAKGWDPYSIWSIYFPFTYVIFHPLSALSWPMVLACFFAVTLAGLWWCFFLILRTALFSVGRAVAGACILLGGTYPVFFCIDRGNIELGLLLLVGGYLLAVRRHHYWTSLAFLVPAMCVKLYPAIFLVLLFRRGRLKYAVAAFSLFLLVTFASLTAFEHTWCQDLKLWQGQLAKYRMNYAVCNGSMGGSASLWNPVKLGIFAATKVKAVVTGQELPTKDEIAKNVEIALAFYSILLVVLASAVTWHVSVIEREFWRKVLLLGLFMVMAPPGGADYKLVYVSLFLAIAIALKVRRRFDLPVVVLLALVLIPKKYWFFPLIVTDSGALDASLGVLLNPMLMLAASGLLCCDGWYCSTVRGRALRWSHARTALAWWPPVRSANTASLQDE